MAFLNSEDRHFLKAVSKLNYVNPFLPERIQYEREALGAAFDESKADWNLLGDDPEFHLINTKKITDRAYPVLVKLQERLRKGVQATRKELELYEDTVLFLVYHYYTQQFKQDIIHPKKNRTYDYFKEFSHYWDLVGYISQRVAGSEGEKLARDVKTWIQDKIGLEYPWPGNIRELEQCVRNIMIRREYHPAMEKTPDWDEGLSAAMWKGGLSLEAICRLYCTQIYKRVGSYAETARRLKIDRRTVKKYVDENRHKELGGGTGSAGVSG